MSLKLMFIFLWGNFVYGTDLLVEVNQGFLRGKIVTTNEGREIYAFMSIPYAKPPVGDLRFKPPVPIEPLTETLAATKIHAKCPQKQVYIKTDTMEGEEDCLYLNVYTPQLPNAKKNLLPVMVFIHGGGFQNGCGNYHCYGPDMLLDKDIVLIAFNYRLGALGFATTGDEILPGNNGLKDQNLALQWIKENVAKFGGDPEKITIFGESAGAACVHLHMLSSSSKGLFQRAISQSGTALDVWALDSNKEVLNYTRKVAELLNCPIYSNPEMVACLRNIHPYKIIEQYDKLKEWDIDPTVLFKPVVEPNIKGAFLSKHPKDIILSGQFAKVPWIIGINTEEGSLRATGIYSDPNLVKEYDENFNRIAPISMGYKNSENGDYISKEIRRFYFGDGKINNSTKLNVIEMYTDAKFLRGTAEAILLHTENSDQVVYCYLFGHRGVSSLSELYGGGSENYGVCHGDELQYLFPLSKRLFPNRKRDIFDQRITKLLTTLWTNFAKTGNPTPDDNPLFPKWKPVSSKATEYYYIGSNIQMGENLLSNRVKFWRNLKYFHTYAKDEL